MRVIISSHSKRRLKEIRQYGVDVADVREAASKIPGKIPKATRFRGFITGTGKMFDLVAKDLPAGRLIITIIGK
ncbi:MAG: hypothetical protein GX318_03340 [Clostridia bacterium]|nr:hypothetical protein [Clostridia bacterium]